MSMNWCCEYLYLAVIELEKNVLELKDIVISVISEPILEDLEFSQLSQVVR